VITAIATVDGSTIEATGTLNVAAAQIGVIEFMSADPTNIGLQGTGGAGRPETSIVSFRVTDSNGLPVTGTDVTFQLDTSVGGIGVSPSIINGDPPATTNASGIVQAVVESGNVATPVRVRATVAATGISTVSCNTGNSMTCSK